MSLSFYLSLIRQLKNTAKKLNLEDLTGSDRIVLLLLYETRNRDSGIVVARYEDFLEIDPTVANNISRAQFYKSIKIAINKGIIESIGSARSAEYQFIMK